MIEYYDYIHGVYVDVIINLDFMSEKHRTEAFDQLIAEFRGWA